jgi:alkylation response protein AidB-like acyl-CoA dehydrogenase
MHPELRDVMNICGGKPSDALILGMMAHPRELLPEAVQQILHSGAAEAENKGRLTEAQLQCIYTQQYLRIWIPQYLGGAEMPLPDAVALLEALCWVDGSVGWVVNLGAGANLFAGYMSPDVARKYFADEMAWAAGSGAISGKAFRHKDGYILTGSWKYASGSAHATLFTFNAWLIDETGQQLKNTAGEPIFSSFAVPTQLVKIVPDWQVMGLRATSSHDFAVHQVWIPEAHRFNLQHPSPFHEGPLYRFPFLTFAEITTSIMLSGMAYHFLDEFEILSQHKKPTGFEQLLGSIPLVVRTWHEVQSQYHQTRNRYYQTLNQVWNSHVVTGALAPDQLQTMKQAAGELAKVSLRSVEKLYPFCGMTSIYLQHPLNRIWRDIHVASQHQLVSPLYHEAE